MCAPSTSKSPVPLALQKFCASGTVNVLCPWHHKKCSHICSLHEQSSQCRSSNQHAWCLKSPLSSGVQSSSGWVVFFLIYPGKFFCSLHSPWEQNELPYHSQWCPMMVSGQSPLLTHSRWDLQSF